jgi:hypothetical protein
MTRIPSPLKLSSFHGVKEPGVIQTLDGERRRKVFLLFAFPPRKEKKFSLLFRLGTRITAKAVTTCIQSPFKFIVLELSCRILLSMSPTI